MKPLVPVKLVHRSSTGETFVFVYNKHTRALVLPAIMELLNSKVHWFTWWDAKCVMGALFAEEEGS